MQGIGGENASITVDVTILGSLGYVYGSSDESIAVRQSHRLSPHSHLDRVVSSQSDASDLEPSNANKKITWAHHQQCHRIKELPIQATIVSNYEHFEDTVFKLKAQRWSHVFKPDTEISSTLTALINVQSVLYSFTYLMHEAGSHHQCFALHNAESASPILVNTAVESLRALSRASLLYGLSSYYLQTKQLILSPCFTENSSFFFININ
jgi:hypothetical protein